MGNDNAKLNGYSSAVVVNNLASTTWQGSISGNLKKLTIKITLMEIPHQTVLIVNQITIALVVKLVNHAL
jgi:hypothetical protein